MDGWVDLELNHVNIFDQSYIKLSNLIKYFLFFFFLCFPEFPQLL